MTPVRDVADRLTQFEKLAIDDALEVVLRIADDEDGQAEIMAREMLELMSELEDCEGGPRPQTPPHGDSAPTTTEVTEHRSPIVVGRAGASLTSR